MTPRSTRRRETCRGCVRAAAGLALLATAMVLPATAGAAEAYPQDSPADVAALAEELAQMKEKLAGLDALRTRIDVLERELEIARARQEEQMAMTGAGKRDVAALRDDTGNAAVEEIEADIPPKGIAFGGALRFNAFWNDFDETVESKRGDSGLDLFRIDADGSIGDMLLSAEYRFYPFMDVIHHGWVGYEFEGRSRLQVGITRVPFGILPYAAHNFWFGTPYYLGLSDDYDLGAKYIHTAGPWEWQAAFFKNGEFTSSTNLDRYSYDVVAVGDTANQETNQVNLRGARTFGADPSCSHEVGFSAQYGEVYNADTDRRGNHWAAAGHLDTRCGRWNLQLQAARYRYDLENPPGVADDTVRLGGFGTSYDVAAEASVLVANVAWNLPVPWEKIDQVTCYNDFSVVIKDEDAFDDSKLNTTGCLVGIGPVYVYLDLIQAENMVFFGNGSLAGGGEDGWHRRFNINVGYYW